MTVCVLYRLAKQPEERQQWVLLFWGVNTIIQITVPCPTGCRLETSHEISPTSLRSRRLRQTKDADDFILKDSGTPPGRYTISICLSGVLAGRGGDSC